MRYSIKLIFLGLLIACSISLIAQTESEILDQLADEFSETLDDHFSESVFILDEIISVNKNHHFLYSGITMSNSTPYAGRDYYSGIGNTLPQVFYINTKGWMFGFGMVKYESLFPVSTSYVLSGGYSFSLDRKDNIRMRFGYSRGTSISSDKSNSLSSSNTLSSSISFNYSKILSSRASYSYMISQFNSLQFSLNFFKNLRLKKWKNGNSVEITPNLNLYFSDHEYPSGLFISNETRTESTYDYEYSSTFGLLNTSLSIPIELNIKDFDFTIEYTHHMPQKFSEYEVFNVKPTFSFSVGYFLFLK